MNRLALFTVGAIVTPLAYLLVVALHVVLVVLKLVRKPLQWLQDTVLKELVLKTMDWQDA